jgi:ribosome-binding ATPase
MAWSCGIVGLPNAGKSTLFKALTALDVTIESYPFSTIDPNKAMIPLPDQRLFNLAQICGSEKATPAAIEIIDVAGLVAGASRGEGLGNQFLGHLRNVDLLIHVLAGFDPLADQVLDSSSRLKVINLELSLADLEAINRRKVKIEAKLKSGDKEINRELATLNRLEAQLDEELPLRKLSFSEDERVLLGHLALLTLKEMVYVYNLDEHLLINPDLSFFPPDSDVIPMCARFEAELAELPLEERELFMVEYGIKQSRSEKLLEACYKRLNMSTFYTVKGKETRAWVIPAGTKAIEAAGKVHTDMERGFINAEVICCENLLEEGSVTKARDKGLFRTEGRDYQVKDGDVIFFRFRH